MQEDLERLGLVQRRQDSLGSIERPGQEWLISIRNNHNRPSG
jgi:hypothetical protein